MKCYTIGSIIGFTISVTIFILSIVYIKKDDDTNVVLQWVLIMAIPISIFGGVVIPIYWYIRSGRDYYAEIRNAPENINYTYVDETNEHMDP
jgi:Mg/Co/Ni transporter MgtE